MTNTNNNGSDSFWTGLGDAVLANPFVRSDDGEHNLIGTAGSVVTATWTIAADLVPRPAQTVAKVVAVTYGTIFSSAGQFSDGAFTMRDGFELVGGMLGGAAVGFVGGLVTGGPGTVVGGYFGGQVGGYLGGELYDLMFDSGARPLIPADNYHISPINLPVTPDNGQVVVRSNSDGSETHSYTDPNSGVTVATRVHVDPTSGSRVGVYSTVIDPNSPMRGQTYPVNAVRNGYELNALDRISEETYARTLVAKKQEEAAAIARAQADRDRQGGGGSSSDPWPQPQPSIIGGATITPTHTTVTNRDGTTSSIQNNYGATHYNNVVNGSLRSLPIVIDLDGDGVEISPLGGSTARFDYDNDGFKELTAWVGKDDGLLIYDVGNDGLIDEAREVVLADWTADTTDSDLDALKTVFDSNNDGILNANDADWANFKIWNDADLNCHGDTGAAFALSGGQIKPYSQARNQGRF